MLSISEQNKENEVTGLSGWVEKTSRKIKAIGAGLNVFLRAIDKIRFSEEPVHVPDQALIDEVVELLTKGKQ